MRDNRKEAIDRAYQRLANAIIMRAIIDREDEMMKDEVDHFIKSDWFGDLCTVGKVNEDLLKESIL